MHVTTVRDLGSLVRAARRAQGMTQADFAARVRVSRDWIVRLEAGHPRLEAQKVLDALVVLGLVLDVEPQPELKDEPPSESAAEKLPARSGQTPNRNVADPFETLFAQRTRQGR